MALPYYKSKRDWGSVYSPEHNPERIKRTQISVFFLGAALVNRQHLEPNVQKVLDNVDVSKLKDILKVPQNVALDELTAWFRKNRVDKFWTHFCKYWDLVRDRGSVSFTANAQ